MNRYTYYTFLVFSVLLAYFLLILNNNFLYRAITISIISFVLIPSIQVLRYRYIFKTFRGSAIVFMPFRNIKTIWKLLTAE